MLQDDPSSPVETQNVWPCATACLKTWSSASTLPTAQLMASQPPYDADAVRDRRSTTNWLSGWMLARVLPL